ncbi:MAG: hypothetical protein COC15_03605, partial [Legionellales bacterium]
EAIAEKMVVIWAIGQCFDTFLIIISYIAIGNASANADYEHLFGFYLFFQWGNTIILAIIMGWLANIEIERLCLKPLSTAINNLLGNKSE